MLKLLFIFVVGLSLSQCQFSPILSSQTQSVPSSSINSQYDPDEVCPKNWVRYLTSCYKFTRSPIKRRDEARQSCRAFNADLASINSIEEHSFIVNYLQKNDPSLRIWYVGGRFQGNNWVNEGDSTTMVNMDSAFLPDQEAAFDKEYLAYSYSRNVRQWGLARTDGRDPLLYICEIPVSQVNLLDIEDRTHEYGIQVTDPNKIPRGPFFTQQPVPVVFDLTRRNLVNYVNLRCLAGGYPTPEYDWYKEEFENDLLVSRRINPLNNTRLTVSGGNLIINEPKEIDDRGKYHCVAKNQFGSIVSESVQLSFGFIGEFNLKRSTESGLEHWGKAIYCDPPQYFPDIQYYWVRDVFPNFVEEDSRTFVSQDGNLYFSSLENIDRGKYSCNVQSTVSSNGRHGPFFALDVRPHPNYQQLKFPNNFPKSFPEAPVVGSDVRLECVAFGYPVPKYNWTRNRAPLPKGAILSNFNRVLLLPNIKVEDMGDYVCRATNDKTSIESTVTVSVQAKPIFTIPLGDVHVDLGDELTWTCEAFGIPEVTYQWLRDGVVLDPLTMDPQDRERYEIRENVLIIKKVDPERDQAMYQCKASNQIAESYSSGQLRILQLKPTFAKYPLETEIYASERSNVTIACNPEAAPRPRFTWKKDGFTIGSGGRRIILPSGHLLINPVSRDDEGNFTCIAENRYGSAESTGRLVVLRGMMFVNQPVQRNVKAVGDSITLSCEASAHGMLDLAYVWKHNGLTIRFDLAAHNEFGEISHYVRSKERGDLEIHNITLAHAGEYECVAKTSVDRISAKSELIVFGPPGMPGGILVVGLTNTSAVLRWTDGANNGDRIRFYRVEGRTNWNSTWTLLRENITIEETAEVDRSTSKRELRLDDVISPWSTYEFRIAAANSFGYGPYSAASPQHNSLPDRIYRPPEGISGGGGKTGDLTITWTPFVGQDQNATGIYYRVYWRRKAGEDPQEVSEETEFQSMIVKTSRMAGKLSVTVDRSRRYYYTPYEVKVQGCNDLGCGPHSSPVEIYSAEDMPQVAPAQVSARAFNSTALNVTWLEMEQSRKKMRGQLIGFRVKYWRRQDNETSSVYYLSRSTQSWALIVGLMPDTYYYVRVMAYNKAGEGPQSERFLERTFKKAPIKPPTTVLVKPVNPSTVKVTWRYVAPSVEEEPLIGYKVRVWEHDQDMSTANDTIVLLGTKLETHVTGLTWGKRYNLRVLAYSQGGDGKMSSPTWVFKMGEDSDVNNSSNYVNLGSVVLLLCLILSSYQLLRF